MHRPAEEVIGCGGVVSLVGAATYSGGAAAVAGRKAAAAAGRRKRVLGRASNKARLAISVI